MKKPYYKDILQMNLLRSSLSRSPLPAIWILVLMTSVGPFGDTEYTPSLPRIADELGVSYAAVQQSMTVYLIAFAMMQLVYGPLSDRVGRKPIALGGALLFTVGSYICWISTSLDFLLIGRFLQGLGSCAGAIISSAAVRDSFDKDKIDLIYTKINTAFAVAPAAGPIVGALVDDHYGWHANMLILLISGLLLLFSVLFFFPETHNPDKNQHLQPKYIWKNYTTLFHEKNFLPAILINGIAIGVVYTSLTEGPALIIKTLGLSSRWIAVVAMGIFLAFVIGSFINMFLQKRLTSKSIVKIGLFFILAGGVCLAAVGYIDYLHLDTVLGSIMLSFIGVALIVPGSVAIAMRPFEKIAGAASAMIGFSQMIIAALANVGVSLLHFEPVYSLAIIFATLAFIGLFAHYLGFKTDR